jgi:hypothetical protein
MWPAANKGDVMSDKPILSAKVDGRGIRLNTLIVFNRGIYCGFLTVRAEDTSEIMRLLEGGEWRQGGQRVEYEVKHG